MVGESGRGQSVPECFAHAEGRRYGYSDGTRAPDLVVSPERLLTLARGVDGGLGRRAVQGSNWPAVESDSPALSMVNSGDEAAGMEKEVVKLVDCVEAGCLRSFAW
ncbi:MAG: hypothetical protein M3548_22325 [Actinomycetota bacterium]|nr:hypothetical protein [Actinomycetota bacterium]